jgi:hypothetical protein
MLRYLKYLLGMLQKQLSHQPVLRRHHQQGVAQARDLGKRFEGMHHHGNACQQRVLLGKVHTSSTARASARDDHMEAGMLGAHGKMGFMGSF